MRPVMAELLHPSDKLRDSCAFRCVKDSRVSWLRRKSPFIVATAISAVAAWRAALYYRDN